MAHFPDSEHHTWFAEHTREIIARCRRTAASVPGWQDEPLTVYLPGGDNKYPSFWIRDAVMQCRSGLVPLPEMLAICRTILAFQHGPEEKKLANGLRITPWAIPDHINLPGIGNPEAQPPGPVFFPGTYQPGDDQGNGRYGLRPADDDIYELIQLAHLIARTLDHEECDHFLAEDIRGVPVRQRLIKGWQAMIVDPQTNLPRNSPDDWAAASFHDGLRPQGLIALTSVLRTRAARQLGDLAHFAGNDRAADQWWLQARQLGLTITDTFQQQDGWLLMDTELNTQPDTWSTLIAIFDDILPQKAAKTACHAIHAAIRDHSIIDPASGYLRHTPTSADAEPGKRVFHDQTEATPCNFYQFGGYWPQCTGFACYALHQIDPKAARHLATTFIDHTRQNLIHGTPVEWLHPDLGIPEDGHLYGPSAALPFLAFTRLGS